MNHANEVGVALAKVAPAVAGLAVAEWLPRVQLIAYTLTALYTATMLGLLIYDRISGNKR